MTLYLGLLFFGFYLMEASVAGLEESERFNEWLTRLDDPVRGALTGGLVTLIIQSSSATVGLAVALGEQGSPLALAGGLAVMLGAELGTCSDTLVATIGGKRAALKAGIFHVVFNLICIAVGLLLFDPFVGLVESISGGQDIDRQIANGHLLFNLMGVVAFLPLVGPAVRVLDGVLPERGGRAPFGKTSPTQPAPQPKSARMKSTTSKTIVATASPRVILVRCSVVDNCRSRVVSRSPSRRAVSSS